MRQRYGPGMKIMRAVRRILWVLVIVGASVGATIYAARHENQMIPVPAVQPKTQDFGPAPGLDIKDLNEADFKGRKVLLVFFASWCAPCKLEHPVLMKLSKSIPVWGVDMMDKPDELQKFFKDGGNPFTRLGVDPSGTSAVDWGVDGIPVTFIVGADGHLIYRHLGPIDETEAENVILPLMQAK